MKFRIFFLLACFSIVSIGLLNPFDADAISEFPTHYVCYHNDMPYTVVFPGLGAPNCPDHEDPAWVPTFDLQDGIDCTDTKGAVCAPYKTRHIDCEFRAEPGDI
ncbi:MAG: hypothetical protein MPN21_27105 [Thermoanaerobaculia bacterium]|nr:hypothetical protein [Thermoanaerobaculia bacterium]